MRRCGGRQKVGQEMNKDEAKNITDEERNGGRLIPPPGAGIRRSPLLCGVCEALNRRSKQPWLFLTADRKGERNPAKTAVAQRRAHPPARGLVGKHVTIDPHGSIWFSYNQLVQCNRRLCFYYTGNKRQQHPLAPVFLTPKRCRRRQLWLTPASIRTGSGDAALNVWMTSRRIKGSLIWKRKAGIYTVATFLTEVRGNRGFTVLAEKRVNLYAHLPHDPELVLFTDPQCPCKAPKNASALTGSRPSTLSFRKYHLAFVDTAGPNLHFLPSLHTHVHAHTHAGRDGNHDNSATCASSSPTLSLSFAFSLSHSAFVL